MEYTRLPEEDTQPNDHHDAESQPLLPGHVPDEVVPPRSFQRKVEGFSIFFLVLVMIGSYVQMPAMNQVLEKIICEKLHPEVRTKVGSEADDICKSADVQDQLAKLLGLINALSCVPSILTTVPYGIIADKYGRKPVMFLGMLGAWLSTMWCLLPLRFPDVFPLWTILIEVVFEFIGGGGGMISAMLWCMVADSVPVEGRTAVYYRIGAAAMVVHLISNPLAATLLRISPWIPLLFGSAMMFVGMLSVFLIPETLDIRRAADKRIEEQIQREGHGPIRRDEGLADDDVNKTRTVWDRTVATMKNDMLHVWRFLIGSKGIMLLILSFALNVSVIRYVNVDISRQYIHKRYDVDWSDATYILTIDPFMNLILMLGVFPLVNWIVARRNENASTVRRDLWVAKIISVAAAVGCFLIAFSLTLPQFIFSYFIMCLAGPFQIVVRAVANAVMEPHTIGVLNTTITLIEQSGVLVSAPLLSWLFGVGVKAGGAWLGLPFLVSGALSLCGTLLIMLFRIPRGIHHGP